MPSKRIRRTILLLLLLSIIYNILRASQSPSEFSPKRTQRKNSTSDIIGTHVPMPSFFKGKEMPFHQVFEPREIGFPADLLTSKPSNVTKLILIWTSWNNIKKTINYYFLRPGKKTFKRHNCPNSNCIATFDRRNLSKADAVLFHLIDTHITDMPSIRPEKQVWIVYNMEPPWQLEKHMSTPIHKLRDTFNWTMGYRNSSNIVMSYGFIVHVNETRELFANKSRMAVWFVSDCGTDSHREEYVKELKKYIDVDIFGRCGNNKCYPSQSSVCYKEILKNYKFYLSFENAICQDYVTEKFFNVFNYDIVPVVFGGANYSAMAPENAFINALHYPHPKKLAGTLIRLANNADAYNKILKRKSSFKAYLDPWMCKLCNELHSPIKSSVIGSVERWAVGDSQCKRWNKTSHSYTQL